MKGEPMNPLKIGGRPLKQVQRIARKHKIDPQVVLDKILDDCVEMYTGHCTVTCSLCHMREDAEESRRARPTP